MCELYLLRLNKTTFYTIYFTVSIIIIEDLSLILRKSRKILLSSVGTLFTHFPFKCLEEASKPQESPPLILALQNISLSFIVISWLTSCKQDVPKSHADGKMELCEVLSMSLLCWDDDIRNSFKFPDIISFYTE